MAYHFRGPLGPMPALMEETAGRDPILWELLDLVDQLDLYEFERIYRDDGSGGQPYDPRLMLVSVWWSYRQGVRSPGAIARACHTQIPLRVLWGASRTPSRSTVERFIQHHSRGWEQVNIGLLRACDRAGLIDVSTTATDSTPVAAPAALSANQSRARIRLQISETEQALAEVIDQVRRHGLDALTGDTAGFIDQGCDTLLRQERQLRHRLAKLRSAEAIADRRDQDRSTRSPPLQALLSRIDNHRRGLAVMTARQQQACGIYQAKVTAGCKPRGAAPRAPADHPHTRAKQAALDKALTKLAALPPDQPPVTRANLTAPHSRILKGKNTTTWVQGDLLTITVGAGQIILAAELPDAGNDHNTLHPHLGTVADNCRQAGITDPMAHHLADAGYASEAVFTTPTATGGTLYIAVTNERAQTGANPPTTATTTGRQHMAERLATTEGAAIYRRRSPMIEPVFAQLLRTDRRLHTRGTAKHTEVTALVTAHNANKYLRNATPPPIPIWVLANDLNNP